MFSTFPSPVMIYKMKIRTFHIRLIQTVPKCSKDVVLTCALQKTIPILAPSNKRLFSISRFVGQRIFPMGNLIQLSLSNNFR